MQYRIAQPGEVLASGGKVLNLVDLSDVYMTFFLPETVVGRVALGSEVHIVLDAAPQYVIPARVSYVASTAQFTPKTVETASERQKLMFRVKAQIDPALLQRHLKLVKTGLPGMAWLKLDAQAAWPADLAIKVPGLSASTNALPLIDPPGRDAPAPVASLVDVSLRYGKVVALDDISLEIPAGRMVGLLGPDGVGKSSLLALLAGARAVQQGSVACPGR